MLRFSNENILEDFNIHNRKKEAIFSDLLINK